MCRQKRTSACHSLHRNAEADPTLDEGPGTETSQTSPVDGASLRLLQVDPRRRGGDTAAGLIGPARSDNVAVGSISQQAGRHGRSCRAASPAAPQDLSERAGGRTRSSCREPSALALSIWHGRRRSRFGICKRRGTPDWPDRSLGPGAGPGSGRGLCRSTCHLLPSAGSVTVSCWKTNTRRGAVCCMANKPACCSLSHWHREANTAADCCLRKSRSRPRDDALAIMSWLGLHAGGCLTLAFYSPAAIGSGRFECGGRISVSNHETPSCICLVFVEREGKGERWPYGTWMLRRDGPVFTRLPYWRHGRWDVRLYLATVSKMHQR